MPRQYASMMKDMFRPYMRHLRRLAFSVSACAGLLVTGQSIAQTDLSDIFQNALACALIEPIFADMPVEPVYTRDGGSCLPVTPDSNERSYFTDATCQTPLAFEVTTLARHCQLLLDEERLGEGAGIDTPVWTLSPGSRLDIGARSLEGISQPYLQRQVYRSVNTPGGTCSLEMRVYADTPIVDTNVLRPSLLALHGGSWSSRGFGFFGLELSIPHYVEQGFVVYAPFYRLLSDTDGSVACNQASIDQIADDASAALGWVREHAADYGSSPTPVVFGQSAGAHLATSLLVNEPESVAAAVLFYPPTDFTDFALRAQQGLYTDEQGLDILERLLGKTADQADINASPIPENSFPTRIVQQNIDVAPVMMVHGMRDNLVEARQSVRLCDALSGRMLQAVDAEVPTVTALRQSIDCGTDSNLQLIKEGEHALDVCFADLPLATDACPSGSEASRREVSSAILEAVNFAALHGSEDMNDGNSDNPDAEVDTNGSNVGSSDDQIVAAESSSGGGAILWLLLIGFCFVGRSAKEAKLAIGI